MTFNVLTTVFTGGTGSAASGAGKAAIAAKALSTAGKVGRFVDPMTYVSKGAGMAATKVSDVIKGHSAQNSAGHQSPGFSAPDNATTGGRVDVTPTSGGHGGGTGPAIPHQSGNHGGGNGSGPGHGSAAGRGLPEPRDPRTYTPAERQAIMEHQVERANSDPAYRKEYYRKNGYRLSDTRTDWTNLVPPQLVKMPDGTWVAKSNLAPPLHPDYLDDIPAESGRKAATPEARAKLDELAKARHDAIAADRPFHVEHGNARREYKLHQTDELRAALDEATERHRGPHSTSTKASERTARKLHACTRFPPARARERQRSVRSGIQGWRSTHRRRGKESRGYQTRGTPRQRITLLSGVSNVLPRYS
ncbi:hypothetical protein [Streptomyces sp. NPDC058382]|uniref:hypothetical protein n=1 Tax=unclassified Streptomyces TaxID=2593676 RepID=UPI0036432426